LNYGCLLCNGASEPQSPQALTPPSRLIRYKLFPPVDL